MYVCNDEPYKNGLTNWAGVWTRVGPVPWVRLGPGSPIKEQFSQALLTLVNALPVFHIICLWCFTGLTPWYLTYHIQYLWMLLYLKSRLVECRFIFVNKVQKVKITCYVLQVVKFENIWNQSPSVKSSITLLQCRKTVNTPQKSLMKWKLQQLNKPPLSGGR